MRRSHPVRHSWPASLLVVLLAFAPRLLPGAPPADDALRGGAGARNSWSFSYAGAVHASGNILGDAILGLDALEALINTRVLFSVPWSEVVQTVGPIYNIPDFVLRNDRFTFQYQRRFADRWSWGVTVGYQVLYAFAHIPVSFFEPGRFGLGNLGFVPVTHNSGGRLDLARSYQLDGGLERMLPEVGALRPSLLFFLGWGSGYLGVDRSAWLQEWHAGLGAAVEYPWSSVDFLKLSFEVLGYTTETRATNFVDRTQVLVNPGNGEIVIVQLRLGVGRRF